MQSVCFYSSSNSNNNNNNNNSYKNNQNILENQNKVYNKNNDDLTSTITTTTSESQLEELTNTTTTTKPLKKSQLKNKLKRQEQKLKKQQEKQIFLNKGEDKIVKDDDYDNLENNDDNNNNNNQNDKSLEEDRINKELPRCKGCGASMQTHSINQPGYIPKSAAFKFLNNHNNYNNNNGDNGDNDTTFINSNRSNNQDSGSGEMVKAGINNIQHHHHSENILKENGESVVENLNETYKDEGLKYFERFHIIKKKVEKESVCQRCYLLKHYGKLAPIKIPVEKFRDNLSNIKDLNCIVIKIVDIMDFNGSFVPNFRRVIGNNPVILVGNKVDVLPDDVHKKRIEDWLRKEAKDRGLVVAHVHLLSSVNKSGMTNFIVNLEKIRRGRDVFVVGCSNVGKSTFVNSLVSEYTNKVEFHREGESESEIESKKMKQELSPIMSKATTSVFPGTTLNLVSIPLWEDSTLFDTPGIDNPYQIIKLLTLEELKNTIPSHRIKPSLAHMISGKTIFLGGLARIDYDGPLVNFCVYVSPHLPLHICNTRKADQLVERQHGALLSPPIGKERIQMYPEQLSLSKTKIYSITPEKLDFKHAYVDIVVSGLGWISIKYLSNKIIPSKITVHTPQNVDVTLRSPLIPFTDSYTLIK
eukprot:gene5762-7170_t